MRRFFATATAVACAWAVSAGGAWAEQTIKFHFVSHDVGVLTMDAGDGVEGHVRGAAKFSGIVTLEDGASGMVTYLADIDYVKGSGSFTIYQTFKFDDGSIIRFKGGGSARLNGSKTEFPDGKFEVIGREGRYSGASGSSEAKGIRLLPIADGGDTMEEGVLHLK